MIRCSLDDKDRKEDVRRDILLFCVGGVRMMSIEGIRPNFAVYDNKKTT
jgi:hypothetical protein